MGTEVDVENILGMRMVEKAVLKGGFGVMTLRSGMVLAFLLDPEAEGEARG